MARLKFVLVVLLAQNVFAISNKDFQNSCDLCIGSGGIWCHSGKKHCLMSDFDTTICPGNNFEQHKHIIENENGILIQPIYAERTLSLRDLSPLKITLTYASPTARTVTAHFRNQKADLEPRIDIEIKQSLCAANNCTVDILARPDNDFCSLHENVEVVIKIDGFQDEAIFKYHVPCTCQCTNETKIRSEKCSKRGNYTCGICTCEPEWTGDICDESCDRGDIEDMCNNARNDELLECSGNGKCGCGKCKCFDVGIGSQYFDPNDKCSDICMRTSDCHSCLLNGTLGECPCEKKHMEVIPRNETLVSTEKADFDGKTRDLWVHCKVNVENCDFDYYAMMAEGDNYFVMINSNCNNSTAGSVYVTASGSKVPIIFGVLGVIAAVATIGGILLWKHMNALPPLPMTDPQYANIDAEDCTGENPLYKPPTSSFKNPTYGKW